MAGAMIGYAFGVLPDIAIDCDESTLACRLSAATMVLKFKTGEGLGF